MVEDERILALEKRLKRLELEMDAGILSAVLTVFGQAAHESLTLAVEQGIANYFSVNRQVFHDNLISVGNRTGRKGRALADNPENMEDFNQKIIVARNILYAIMHIDFCIPIQDLSIYYSVNVKNYVSEWKNRYIRIFHSNQKRAKHDDVYEKYWLGAYAAIVAECQRLGICDKLFEKLKRFDEEDKVSYIYLKKWRVH